MTLFHSEVALSERWKAGVVIAVIPRFTACKLGFSALEKMVASLELWPISDPD